MPFQRLREYPLIQKEITEEKVRYLYLGSKQPDKVTELIKTKANHELQSLLNQGWQDAIIEVTIEGVSIWAELMTENKYDCACYILSSWNNMDEYLSS